MPALLRVRGYRFFFFSLEGREPPHMHVAHAGRYAKFWLEPVQLANNRGFRGVPADLDGVRVSYIDRESFRVNKLAAGRDKDLKDLRRLGF